MTLPKKSASLSDEPFASFNDATETSGDNPVIIDGEAVTVGAGVVAAALAVTGIGVAAVAPGTKSPRYSRR